MQAKFLLEKVGYEVEASGTQGRQRILSDVGITIPAGQIFTITGPSGSGKSSLLYLLNLLRDPTTGVIFLDGQNMAEMNVLEVRRKVGIVFQKPFMFKGSVRENLLLGPKLKGSESRYSPEDLLEMMGLEREMARKEAILLSGGEQQRVSLARALANEPDVLLLDEVTSALDADSACSVEKLVKALCEEKGITVVWVTHDMEQLMRVGDNSLLLIDGRVAFTGTSDEFKHQYFPSKREMNTELFTDGRL
ncbi:MAG: phosphate ABC transporter ATP-binding protein [Syntrophomonadaceae bacterium]|nr:phosphate ABC transporter ATP-binding protein [Syntrophomonadaceae bacterium]